MDDSSTQDDQKGETSSSVWVLPLLIGLTGVAIGAIIGAITGMWWMMGVLGGVFGGVAPSFIGRNRKS